MGGWHPEIDLTKNKQFRKKDVSKAEKPAAGTKNFGVAGIIFTIFIVNSQIKYDTAYDN